AFEPAPKPSTGLHARLRRPAGFLLAFLLGSGLSVADAGAPEAAPVDVDADFARAADLLEASRRAEAEEILDGIRRRKNQPAWDARIAFLLAADDVRRRDYAVAAARLETPASSIGLEPYRELARAEALELAVNRD